MVEINKFQDLKQVWFVARTPEFMVSTTNAIFAKMVQSLAIHPDWTLDTFISWLVNDDFMDPTDIIGAFGGRSDDIPHVWEKAKGAAAGWVIDGFGREIDTRS